MINDIKELIQLLNESTFSDLFDDDPDLFDNEFDVITDEASKNYYQANLYNVLLPILGTDKPRAWKKAKNENNEDILIYQNKKSADKIKYISDVENLLKKHNFKEYTNACVPLAYKEGYINLKKFNDKYNYLYNPAFWTERYNIDLKRLSTYPQFIVNYFKKDESYKTILISEDNGIIYTFQSSYYTTDYYKYKLYWCKAEIKLTGEVLYQDMSNKERDNILATNKNKKQRIDILRISYNKLCSNSYYFKEYNINSEGFPYSIYYFNWAKEVNRSNKSLKQKNIPYCVYYFIKYGHFNYVQKFEKEDDNSIYELIKNSISIKIYKNISQNINNTNIPKNMDSCMILELTGYLKDYYEEFFNNNKH